RRGFGAPELGIAVFTAAPDAAEHVGELLVGGPQAQRGSEIVARSGEEAGLEAALGREAGPGAAAAERLRHRGDDADLPGAVAVGAGAGGLVGAGERRGVEGPGRVDLGDDLLGGDDVVEAPSVRVSDV